MPLIHPFIKFRAVSLQNRTGKGPILTYTVVYGGLVVVLIRAFEYQLESEGHPSMHVYTNASMQIVICDQFDYDDAASNFKYHSTSGVIDGYVGCLRQK